MGRVLSVNVGRVEPVHIDGREVMTGFRKRPLAGGGVLRSLGLEGDEQADQSVHGGLDKAVYAYPHEHYRFWATVRAQAGQGGWHDALPAGSLGENLTIEGLLEAQAWVGDLLQFPHCTLAVSAPRMPCFKFDAAMGFRQASKLMAQSGYCGFYLAVREAGRIEAGDRFELQPGPREVSIAELFAARLRR